MTSSKEIKERHDKVMFPCTSNYYAEPIAIDRGEGCRVTDVDGRDYLDFFGGILTVSVGHGNEKVKAAVKAQIDRVSHVSTLYPSLPMVELAERLVKIAPGKLDKVYFMASGTEADEWAVTCAQAYTNRTEIIALRHGYSGRSMLAQSLTAHAPWRIVPTQVAAVKHAPAPYCYRCPFKLKPETCERECAQDIEELIKTTTTGEPAAFLAEPIMGVGGFITPPDDYFQIAVGIVRKYGGLFISDEVQTGVGRLGQKWWGCEHYGVEPDVMTLAKGIANGLPISATLATTEVASSIKKLTISTFGGNPISSSAASAVLSEIEDRQLLDNATERGRELRSGLEGLKERFGIIGDVRGKGLMQGLELVVDEKSGDRTPNPGAMAKLFEETKKRGLLIGKGGLVGNCARISPPLVVSASEVQDALQVLEESFAAICEG